MVVKIDFFDYFGRGVTRIENKVCFVIGAQKGEVVEIKIIEEKKNYSIAEVVRYIEKSKDRIEARCPYYKSCGGCDLGEMSYEASLKLKENAVLEELAKNDITDFQYLGIEKGTPYHYRNKITLHSDGKNLGFYKEESHELVPIEKCLLVDERINEIIPTLPVEKDVMIRVSNQNDDMLIGDTKKTIVSFIGTKKYRISSRSFFQVNEEVTKKLYDYVYETVLRLGAKNVLDLYCGIGTIGIYIHDIVESVLGIEIVEEAIRDAHYNKELNHASNVSFLCGNVSDYIKKLQNQYDFIIVDPPRGGIQKKALDEMIRIYPQKIIYISCNKRTLIRDLKRMESAYKMDSIKLFDMFPNTYHVECVCVLNKSI